MDNRNRIVLFNFLLVGFLLMVSSCEPKAKPNANGDKISKGSPLEESIREDIVKLRSEIDWAKAQGMYATINADIDKYVKKKSRGDFHDDANNAYCHSMDSIIYIILSSECSSRHKDLNEIWNLRIGAEYNGITSPLHSRVAAMQKNHADMLRFIRDVKGNRQKNISSFNTAYDEAYESTQKDKARQYLTSSPTCREIINGLTSIRNGVVFNSRRLAFCQKVVDLYLEKSEWNQGDENILISRINFYVIDHRNDDKVLQWLGNIEKFKEEHRP